MLLQAAPLELDFLNESFFYKQYASTRLVLERPKSSIVNDITPFLNTINKSIVKYNAESGLKKRIVRDVCVACKDEYFERRLYLINSEPLYF